MMLAKLTTGLSIALLLSTTALATQVRQERTAPEKKIEIIKKGAGGDCRVIKFRRGPSSKIDYKNIVSSEAAMAAAEKHAQGKAFDVRLLAHGVPRYQVRVATEEGVKYLQVAADTGKVIAPRQHKDTRIFDALRGKGDDAVKMDLKQAMSLAQKEVKGRIISASLHPEPGNMAYSVVIETKKEGAKNVLISGSTGKILAIRDHHGMMNFAFGEMPVPPVPPVAPAFRMGPHTQRWISKMGDQDIDFAFERDEGDDHDIEVVREFRHTRECD